MDSSARIKMARINRDPAEQERLRRLYEQQQTIKQAGNPREEEAVAKLQQQALLKQDKEQQQQQATDLDAVSRASSADSISKVCKVSFKTRESIEAAADSAPHLGPQHPPQAVTRKDTLPRAQSERDILEKKVHEQKDVIERMQAELIELQSLPDEVQALHTKL